MFPTIIQEGEKAISNSLVGFLKYNENGVQNTISWLKLVWGKMAVGVKLIGNSGLDSTDL